MNNTSDTVKRGRGRPRKDATNNTDEKVMDMGIPVMLEPTIHDIHDELARMDSFSYSRYND